MANFYWLKGMEEPLTIKFSPWMMGSVVGNLLANVGRTLVNFGDEIATVSVAAANYATDRIEMHDKATLEIEDMLSGIFDLDDYELEEEE
jgi:hypothetical protein